MTTIKKFLYLLSPGQYKELFFLFIMILVMAILDVVGVASILPFMTILTNPDLIQTNLILNKIFQFSKIFGVENNLDFIFILGIFVFLLLVVSLMFKAITIYLQVKFVQNCEYKLSKRLIELYLHQPYDWFLNRNSVGIGKTILSEVGHVIGHGIKPMIELIVKGTVVIAMIALLLVHDPRLTLFTGLLFGLLYGLIYYVIKKYLRRIGEKRLDSNESRFLSTNDAFGAIKEVKIGGLEQFYIKNFSDSAKDYAASTASSQVLGQIPRYFLETLAFGGIMLLILYLMFQSGSYHNAIPVISLYVFAGYRLLPSLQQIYLSITKITFIGPSLEKIYNDVNEIKPMVLNENQDLLSLNDSISLKNISYNYPNTTRSVLKNININIPSKTATGFVGTTGSGKTTLVDIILGLLDLREGNLEIDGKIITKKNSRSWQKLIGYVPQNIYLSDKSVLENIAFGIDHKNINKNAVEEAAKISNLHDFVIDELPDQYLTKIGERGVRLSGGQRQRIGIARALYFRPKLLILDEATSALDNKTEKKIINMIYGLTKDTTIIMIAHRLSTIKNCDKIYILDKGKIKNEGTFQELIKSDSNFRSSLYD